MESMILSSIEFSTESISELNGHRKSVSIARSDIRTVSLRYGFIAERPIAQAILSIVLVLTGLCLGVYPLYGMFLRNDFPSSGYVLKPFAYAVPLVLIGGYYFYMLFAKRFYLLVHTRTGERKLIFTDKLSVGEVLAFLMNCNNSLGYGVQIEPPWLPNQALQGTRRSRTAEFGRWT